MIEIRFHGRGGQGAKVASRIVGRGGFLAGLHAQDFPLFGAERRGAPIVACTRLSHEVIDRRGYIEEPEVVVVLDDSLLKEAYPQIFHGVRAGTPVLINTHATEVELPVGTQGIAPGRSPLPPVAFIPLDLTAIARRVIGRNVLSAIAAGAVAKLIPGITTDILAEAIRIELGEVGLPLELVEKNVAAAKEAYTQLPSLFLPERPALEEREVETPKVFPLPFFNAALGASTIRRTGGTVLRHTGGWRVERPEINLEKCKRCFLCFLFCPDAAVSLDEENYPHIDYEHCKGCMICYEECPPRAIARRLEKGDHGT